jgi:hypothetical protein
MVPHALSHGKKLPRLSDPSDLSDLSGACGIMRAIICLTTCGPSLILAPSWKANQTTPT